MKRQATALLPLVLSLLLTLTFSTPGFSQAPDLPDIAKLKRDSGGQAEITWNLHTNTASFIRARVSRPTIGVAYDASPASMAITFVDRYADLLGVTNAASELNLLTTETDSLGMGHVTLHQVYQGVDVYNAQVKVHLSADGQQVVAASNGFVPGIQLASTQPQVSAAEALAGARKALPNGTLLSGPHLVIYPRTDQADVHVLAWLVELRDDAIPARNVYVVDAEDGTLIDALDILYDYDVDSKGIYGVETTSPTALCDPAVYYGVQHCSDDSGNTHIIVVNLNDPNVRVQTVLSSGPNGECNSVNHQGKDQSSNCPPPTYPFETVSSMLQRYMADGAVAIINTDYFGQENSDHGAEGLAVRNGNRLDGPAHGVDNSISFTSPSLAISSANTAVIGIPGSQEVIDTNLPGTYYNTVGGAPIIVSESQPIGNNACNSSYPGDTCRSSEQSAAGLTNDGHLVLITAKKDATGISNYLTTNYQVHTALKFDGGGSANLAWVDSTGQIQSYDASGQNRAVAEGLAIFSTKLPNTGFCPMDRFYAEYYNNPTLTGDPNHTSCQNAPIAHDWVYAGPGNGLGSDNFSIRWTGSFSFEQGSYTFFTRSDDGMRMWIDGVVLFDNWRDQPPTSATVSHDVSAGNHEIKVEYYERGGGALAYAHWWRSDADADDDKVLTGGQTIWATIAPSGDTDTFYFDAVRAQKASIQMTKVDGGVDPVFTLYAPDGSQVARDESGGGNGNASISRLTLFQEGRYRIVAGSQGGAGGMYSLALITQIPKKDRKIYNNYYVLPLPGILARSEGDAPTGDDDVDRAYDFTGAAYDYYKNTHGRDSYDDQGATMIASVHYGILYRNAFWNGSQMVYGNGFPVEDVTAHELTHAVTERTAKLEYNWQSGALNESFSDIFGAMVDRDDWLIGEDLPKSALGGRPAIRNMANPAEFKQPASAKDWVETCSDNQGVHSNSGIINKAYYNIATAIGKEKAEQIFYRTLTVYLQPKSSLKDARGGAIKSAEDLYSSDTSVADAVRDGFNAVGVDGTWNPPPNSCSCAATTVLGDAAAYPDRMSALDVAATLYRVRDQLLSPTVVGQRYRTLYEQHTGRASFLLLLDPSLRSSAGNVLRMFTPGFMMLMDGHGQDAIVTREMTAELVSFLRRLADTDRANGGGALAETIDQELARVDPNQLVGMSFAQAWAYVGSRNGSGTTVYLPILVR